MVFYKSHQGYVLIGQESAFGTPVTTNKDIGLVQNSTWEIDNGFIRSHGLSSADAQAKSSGAVVIRGTIEVDFQHGRFLQYALGSVAHDNSDTPDIKHTFTLADTLPSMSFEDGADGSSDAVQKFDGVKVESLTLALDLGSVLKMRATLVAQNVVDNTSSGTAVIDSLPTFRAHQATVSTGAESSESAITDGAVQSFEITINNNGGGEFFHHGFGSRLIGSSDPTTRLIDFRFTKIFESNAEIERFLGTTSPLDTGAEISDFGLIFNVNNGVSAGNGRREVNINLSDCAYSNVRKVGQVGSHILMEFTGFALTIDDFFTYDDITDANWGDP